MLKITCSICIILISSLTIHAQRIINGNVLNTSGEPIPYAHLKIKDSSRGTLTNLEGNFSLILLPNDSALQVSSIGYKSKVVTVLNSDFLTITLEEDVLELQSVTIRPQDVGKTFIDLILENIAQNYSIDKELIDGFIREKVSRDSLGTDIYYISEAEVQVLKEDYRKSKKRGDVRLVKGRKITGDLTDLGWRIYAGGHLAHRFDVVMRRTGPLGKNKVDQYNYDIVDTLAYDAKPLFKLIFWNEDQTHQGTFFVLDESYALIKAEQYMVEKYPENGIFARDNSRKFILVTTEYSKADEKTWSINYVNYRTGFTKDTTELYLNSIFTAHNKTPTEEGIPYHERIQYDQFLLEETEEYDPEFWDGFNTTMADSTEQEFLNSLAIQKKQEEEVAPATPSRFLNIARSLEFNYGFTANQYSLQAHNIVYNESGLNLNENIRTDDDFNIGLNFGIGLKITDNWSVHFASNYGIDNFLEETMVGASYRFKFSERSRFSINTGANFLWGIQGIQIQEANNIPAFELNDKEFNASTIAIFTATEYGAFVPSIELLFEKSSRLQLVLGFQDFILVSEKNGLYFKEEQNIFRRKTTFLENGDNGLAIESDSGSNVERTLSLYVGVKLTL